MALGATGLRGFDLIIPGGMDISQYIDDILICQAVFECGHTACKIFQALRFHYALSAIFDVRKQKPAIVMPRMTCFIMWGGRAECRFHLLCASLAAPLDLRRGRTHSFGHIRVHHLPNLHRRIHGQHRRDQRKAR